MIRSSLIKNEIEFNQWLDEINDHLGQYRCNVWTPNQYPLFAILDEWSICNDMEYITLEDFITEEFKKAADLEVDWMLD